MMDLCIKLEIEVLHFLSNSDILEGFLLVSEPLILYNSVSLHTVGCMFKSCVDIKDVLLSALCARLYICKGTLK